MFHDKRLGADGEWLAPDVEKYHSAESALFLAYKWSRDDVLDQLVAAMTSFPDAIVQRAVAAFLRRRARDEVPVRLDPRGRTAEFVAGQYAVHRW